MSADLKPSDFRLLDNEKPQDIKVDMSYDPISLVVAIQANWDMERRSAQGAEDRVSASGAGHG